MKFAIRDHLKSLQDGKCTSVFKDILAEHFRIKKRSIAEQLTAWSEMSANFEPTPRVSYRYSAIIPPPITSLPLTPLSAAPTTSTATPTSKFSQLSGMMKKWGKHTEPSSQVLSSTESPFSSMTQVLSSPVAPAVSPAVPASPQAIQNLKKTNDLIISIAEYLKITIPISNLASGVPSTPAPVVALPVVTNPSDPAYNPYEDEYGNEEEDSYYDEEDENYDEDELPAPAYSSTSTPSFGLNPSNVSAFSHKPAYNKPYTSNYYKPNYKPNNNFSFGSGATMAGESDFDADMAAALAKSMEDTKALQASKISSLAINGPEFCDMSGFDDEDNVDMSKLTDVVPSVKASGGSIDMMDEDDDQYMQMILAQSLLETSGGDSVSVINHDISEPDADAPCEIVAEVPAAGQDTSSHIEVNNSIVSSLPAPPTSISSIPPPLPPQPIAALPTLAAEWECLACTMSNPALYLSCGICGTTKGQGSW